MCTDSFNSTSMRTRNSVPFANRAVARRRNEKRAPSSEIMGIHISENLSNLQTPRSRKLLTFHICGIQELSDLQMGGFVYY